MATKEEKAELNKVDTALEKLEKELKSTYGTVYKITIVPNEDVKTTKEFLVGYFKGLDFKTASVVAKLSVSDPLSAAKILAQNTIIKEHSDSEILDNWQATVSAGQELQRLVEFPNASAAKL
ncbi:hypothetical protein V9L05_19980 [Bernardetia sp. Wsw4-3y2]|uniref:hypothetical protein n=1 Tax=Bernardetia sp. Wsw4-3y2 TaxID=3127471 RepID=UPI0030D06A2C